ncbi:LOW QUALITY PROTEIN: uncharacterized protein WM294_014192 [Sarcoramphus papa]
MLLQASHSKSLQPAGSKLPQPARGQNQRQSHPKAKHRDTVEGPFSLFHVSPILAVHVASYHLETWEATWLSSHILEGMRAEHICSNFPAPVISFNEGEPDPLQSLERQRPRQFRSVKKPIGYALLHHSQALGVKLSLLITTRGEGEEGGGREEEVSAFAVCQLHSLSTLKVSCPQSILPMAFQFICSSGRMCRVHLAEVQPFKSHLPQVHSTPLKATDRQCVFILMEVNLQLMPRTVVEDAASLLLTSAFLLLPWAGAGRIIGGWEAKPHSRPYMAYVSIGSESGRSQCGGFLLCQDAVLSAAHCVAGKTKVNIITNLGAHNVSKKELSQQAFHVGHWVIHPNYSGYTIENNIMLLKLKPRAKLTKEVSRISWPSHNERVEPGTTCKVADWGWTSMTRDKTSVLMEVDLKVQSEEVCEKSFKRNYLRQSMICAGDKDGNKSTFRGDSGGPLVCNGKAHGFVSYGHRNHIFPKGFTVSYFEPWIREELRKFVLQDLPASPSSD